MMRPVVKKHVNETSCYTVFFMLFVFYYKRIHSLIFSQSAYMLDPHCHFALEAKVCV